MTQPFLTHVIVEDDKLKFTVDSESARESYLMTLQHAIWNFRSGKCNSPEFELGIGTGTDSGANHVIFNRHEMVPRYNGKILDNMLECLGLYMTEECKIELTEGITEIAIKTAKPTFSPSKEIASATAQLLGETHMVQPAK